jgi:long-chain acyl-CoA synthetase
MPSHLAQASGMPELVHSRLARWAIERGPQCALQSETGSLTFAELAQRVEAHACALQEARAPSTVLQDCAPPILERLVAFLGTVASGRCAAVCDSTWPSQVWRNVQANVRAEPSGSQPCDNAAPTSLSPFYIGFTSGSTGQPKGFRRHHRSWTESFQACLQSFGGPASERILAPGRDSHSLFLFGMLLGLWTGAGVVVQEQFSASAALHTLAQGETPCLVAVPSQLLLMLDWAAHRQLPAMEDVRLILISGARWPRHRTPDVQALFPNARVVEFYGASETSFIAWTDSSADLPENIVGVPFSTVEIDVRGATGPDSDGLIFVRSPMVFMDYVGQSGDSTAALRDGDWVSVRDIGHLDAQGRLCVIGRESRMLVTAGKKLFPEELESVLESHPSIASASVHGVPDPHRGVHVAALIRWNESMLSSENPLTSPNLHDLQAWCRERLEAFKTPRQIWICAEWASTPSGKTDHTALGQALAKATAKQDTHPWLTLLR